MVSGGAGLKKRKENRTISAACAFQPKMHISFMRNEKQLNLIFLNCP